MWVGLCERDGEIRRGGIVVGLIWRWVLSLWVEEWKSSLC
jgi:hypothetical protein